jgi:hypothetical protein
MPQAVNDPFRSTAAREIKSVINRFRYSIEPATSVDRKIPVDIVAFF